MTEEAKKLVEEIENSVKISPVKSYLDLEVYQISYKAVIIIFKEILDKLPDHEKYDLKNQLSRSTKAIPRLIAEGYAKKHQKRGYIKYLDDALAENNETVVGLSQVYDLYGDYIDKNLCKWLIDLYNRIGKQIFTLSQVWKTFSAN